jgi:hypothetical protein
MTTYSEFLKEIGLSALLMPLIVAITAGILKWLNKKISKFDVPYSRAFTIELIIGAAGIVLSTVLGIIGIWANSFAVVNLAMLVLLFLLGTPFYAKMLVHPESGPIGWGKGFVYSIIFGTLDVVLQFLTAFVPIMVLSLIY